MIRGVVIGIALALTAPGHAARADAKLDAQAHVETAQTAHASGDYNTAYTELKAAYAIDPQPELLFALGQVLVKLDRCQEAIRDYKKFLATQKDKDARAITKQAIASCKTTLANETNHHEEPAAEPSDPDKDPDRDPAAVGDGDPPPGGRAAFYTDVVGDALVAGGVLAGVVSAATYASGRSELDDAEHAATLADYQSKVDSAHTKRTIAIIAGLGGITLIGFGIMHYMHFNADRGASAVALAPAPTGDGGFVVWQGVW